MIVFDLVFLLIWSIINFLKSLIMKKQELKNLSLNKKSIANFDQSKEIIGGMKSIPLENCQYFPTNPNSECGSDTGLDTAVECVGYSVIWCHSEQC